MDSHVPQTLRFPADPARADRDPRCLGCGYRLIGLDTAACPECGRRFDPSRPKTYSRRQPFVWHQYWWPGALLALTAAFGWSVVFYRAGELGWGLFIGVPCMLGALMGYRPLPTRRGRVLAMQGVVVFAVIVLVVMLMLGGLAGLFCGVLLLGVFVPIALGGFLAGVACARVLALVLKQTRFSQREYLPAMVALLLLPGLAHVLQVMWAPPIAPTTVQTTRVIAADAEAAWDAQLFYEEVPGPRPVLHRIGLPRPVHVAGELRAAGDRQRGYYSGGRLVVKEAITVKPGRRLAFRIAEQHGFEDASLRFMEGRFDFMPVAPDRTRVMLTSRYQPMLRPRALWRPIEQAMAGELHGHILSGMAREAGQASPIQNANLQQGGVR